MPFLTQFAMSALFDPLNFLGPAAKGAGMFAASARVFGAAEAAENVFLRAGQLAIKGTDGVITGAASRVEKAAAGLGRGIAERTPITIRAQFVSVRKAREAQREMLDEARAMGFPGKWVDEATLTRLRRLDQENLKALQGHTEIGQILDYLSFFGSDMFNDAAQTQLSETARS